MAPKRKRKATDQPGWPAAAIEEAQAARAAAVRQNEASYTNTFKWTEGETNKSKTMYIVNEPAPTIYGREVTKNTESRMSKRPSS